MFCMLRRHQQRLYPCTTRALPRFYQGLARVMPILYQGLTHGTTVTSVLELHDQLAQFGLPSRRKQHRRRRPANVNVCPLRSCNRCWLTTVAQDHTGRLLSTHTHIGPGGCENLPGAQREQPNTSKITENQHPCPKFEGACVKALSVRVQYTSCD
jgi:hypothetical protein